MIDLANNITGKIYLQGVWDKVSILINFATLQSCINLNYESR